MNLRQMLKSRTNAVIDSVIRDWTETIIADKEFGYNGKIYSVRSKK